MGILAAGLLATIDPLEQLRKGADSNKKTTALEFINAVTRFYSSRGVMPWDDARYAGCTDPAAGGTALNSLTACMTALITEGELKGTFDDDVSATSILADITVGGNATDVKACFDPESKGESRRAETKWTTAALTDAGTCDPVTSTTCFWCAQ